MIGKSLINNYNTATQGAGTVAGSGNTITEQGSQGIHRTIITFTNTTFAFADSGAQAFAALKIYDFPEGAIYIQSCVADIALTKSSAGVNDTWDGDFGLGTAACDSGTLSGTEDDILPTTATPQASSGATTATGQSTSAEHVVFDGTGGAKDLYFNIIVDTADHDVAGTACNVILNGTIILTWINMGDY